MDAALTPGDIRVSPRRTDSEGPPPFEAWEHCSDSRRVSNFPVMATHHSRARHRARRVSAACLLAACLAFVPAAVTVAEGENPRATIRVEDARVDPATPGRGASPVVVALEPGEALAAFEVGLQFDPAAVRVLDTNPDAPGIQPHVDGRWAGATVTVDNAAGTVEAAGEATAPCTGPQVCTLFVLAWEAVGEGTAEVTVTSFALAGTDGIIDDVAVVDAVVAVTPGSDAAEELAGRSSATNGREAGSVDSRLMLAVGAGVLMAAALGIFTIMANLVRFAGRRVRRADPLGGVREQAAALLDQAEAAGRRAGGGRQP